MILTTEWQPYDGKYQKQLQDIKLKNGDVITHCWPNAGFWHPSKRRGNAKYYGKDIPHDQAEFVKLSNQLE